MKKYRFLRRLYPLYLLLLAGVLFNCADTTGINARYLSVTRVEYSDCTACFECIEDFSCPENAIIKDTLRTVTYIDTTRCTRCMRCIDDFQCRFGAIIKDADYVLPDKISDFVVTSDTPGEIKLSFTAPGDDGVGTRCFRYQVDVSEAHEPFGNHVTSKEIVPSYQGSLEQIILADMPEGMDVRVTLTAFDEAGNHSDTVVGETLVYTNLPPGTITDLSFSRVGPFVRLAWMAQGGDGDDGRATTYQICYSSNPLTAANWSEANVYPNSIVPLPGGQNEVLLLTTLPVQDTYYIAIKAIDEFGLSSEISNVVVVE